MKVSLSRQEEEIPLFMERTMNRTKQLVLTALFIAIGVVLPQAFHMIPNAGSIFLPMHIPVLVAGYVVGPFFGAICGFLTPLLSHFIFGMPPTPMLGQMLCELAVYGFMTGLLNKVLKIENDYVKAYVVLILSMLCGRLVYGVLNALIFKAGNYSLQMWLSAALSGLCRRYRCPLRPGLCGLPSG